MQIEALQTSQNIILDTFHRNQHRTNGTFSALPDTLGQLSWKNTQALFKGTHNHLGPCCQLSQDTEDLYWPGLVVLLDLCPPGASQPCHPSHFPSRILHRLISYGARHSLQALGQTPGRLVKSSQGREGSVQESVAQLGERCPPGEARLTRPLHNIPSRLAPFRA